MLSVGLKKISWCFQKWLQFELGAESSGCKAPPQRQQLSVFPRQGVKGPHTYIGERTRAVIAVGTKRKKHLTQCTKQKAFGAGRHTRGSIPRQRRRALPLYSCRATKEAGGGCEKTRAARGWKRERWSRARGAANEGPAAATPPCAEGEKHESRSFGGQGSLCSVLCSERVGHD
jgi:hypothetical protein